MSRLPSALAFTAAMAAGVYLVTQDHVTLGGWVLVLSLLGSWGFEKGSK